MKRIKMSRWLCGSALCSLWLFLVAVPSSAQFPGDVFFLEPSVAVPAGQSAELEVVLFAGADPFGAAHVEIEIEPGSARVEVVEVPTAEFQDASVYEVADGLVSAVVLNSGALDGPIGTVSLLRLQIVPLVPVGSTVELGIRVRSLLLQSTEALAGQGFSGEVLVVPSTAELPNSAETGAPKSLVKDLVPADPRASGMRRPGSWVTLVTLSPSGDVTRNPVQVPHDESVTGPRDVVP